MQRPNSHRDQARDAERYFPVRIRVARGKLGRDRQYQEMCQWLDEQIGAANWFHVEERLPALPDTLLFYCRCRRCTGVHRPVLLWRLDQRRMAARRHHPD